MGCQPVPGYTAVQTPPHSGSVCEYPQHTHRKNLAHNQFHNQFSSSSLNSCRNDDDTGCVSLLLLSLCFFCCSSSVICTVQRFCINLKEEKLRLACAVLAGMRLMIGSDVTQMKVVIQYLNLEKNILGKVETR